MVEGTAELIDELRGSLARTEGELAATREQAAALVANEVQLRVELEAAKAEGVAAQTSLTHAQRLADERAEALQTRVADLSQQLEEARRSRLQAEQERAAVIAALGRRARRRLETTDSNRGSPTS